MFCINQESDDPFFNLAIEEILLKSSEDEYMLLGINNPSVIIGKHQSANKEVNTKFLFEKNIPVIRRISGGGTVFHDKGNLNFTFIRQSESGKQVDFRKYTQPVIDFLVSSGIDAKFEGGNDIKVGGFKISGNAEHVHRNRVLHHGTLLFSTSLEMLRNTIRNDKSYYSSRAVESNPSAVINLNGKLNNFSDISEFRSGMMNYFLTNMANAVKHRLTPSVIENAVSLALRKYSTWEWNYAYGPEYIFRKSFTINGNLHSCSLFVKDGIIRKCSLEGSEHMRSVANELTGCRHMVTDMLNIFKSRNILVSDKEIFNFF